jgi:hypothetical protein
MKTTVLHAGLTSPHAGWAAIDELAELPGHYFRAEILSPRTVETSWGVLLLQDRRKRYAPLKTSGGDVLIVVARNPGDLGMVNAIPGCREKFSRIYGFVTDSYFRQGFLAETSLFDAITVTAHEDVSYPKTQFGIDVRQLYQGADCLAWAPRGKKAGEIDVMGFGRMPSSYHARFSQSFHQAESPFLYLHSPLGNLTGNGVQLERGMLFKLLHRTRISLAFHLFVEPEGERPRSMMVTSRWLESLLSGCIVAGRRPASRMADEMLFWPGATTELSENPEFAVEELRTLLENNEALEQQRCTNIRQTIANHDWRHRNEEFCRMMGLPAPQSLQHDLDRLAELGASFACPGLALKPIFNPLTANMQSSSCA